MNVGFHQTAIGTIGIVEDAGTIVALLFDGGKAPSEAQPSETPLLREAFSQLDAYLAGSLRSFDLPLKPSGTAFQQAVWAILRDIPYGAVRSYKEVASALDKPKAVRAVGMANNRNPIPIFIPCHRVIGSGGGLVGYAGGLAVKERLLALERAGAGR